MMPAWALNSWEKYENHHEFCYPTPNKLTDILHDLSRQKPLVTPGDIENLKSDIGSAGTGHAFILQAGDCAESFHDFESLYVMQQIQLLLKMRDIIAQDVDMPIVTIGRIAGQYAKPRTLAEETRDGVTLPSYRGDLINQSRFNSISRQSNPNFLTLGYQHAKIVHELIARCLIGARQPVYSSHEALHIPYEQSLTREVDGKWYLLSTHLPWIGMRNAFIESAHVEFLRGISNPIGLKVSSNLSPKFLVQLVERLNPLAEHGRLLLITRMGADLIDGKLPELIEAVQACGIPVTWMCDPMHGNTICTSAGIKTRHMDTIVRELKQSMIVHTNMNSVFSGAHFELTAQNVTECLGGEIGIKAADLKNAYHTLVDPRLNKTQAIEIAQDLNHFLRNINF